MTDEFWLVAVDAPLQQPLTYQGSLLNQGSRGLSVQVPLGRRKVCGVVLGPASSPSEFAAKEIQSFDAEKPILPECYLKWIEWLSRYYLHPIGQVAQLAFPPLNKQLKARKSRKSPVVPNVARSSPLDLTDEQRICVEQILNHKGFASHLVHGVTGSGKTEVYLRLLQQVIDQGRQGIVLVPEISLTPQLIHRFAARFGDQVAVIHSHLTDREKTNQWWDMIEGRKQILVGARSALFCPLPNVGMIVIDEEHEPSFKQDEKLKYHARDAAIMLGKLHDCPVVLGSATPSLESWQNALSGKFQLHTLKSRVMNRSMPNIEVVDLREEKSQRKDPLKKNAASPDVTELPFWMSRHLYEAMVETLENGEQSALFLNRRGMAQTVLCESCGTNYQCPNCAVSLTLHARHHLICHYCDYHENLSETCRECKVGEPKALGVGTEKIEQDLQLLFPNARLGRADRDEIQNREDLEELISQIELRQIDILIGTQMIAKGLDFPGLTLVGLVLADIGFNLPDFRASERSFQLLTQVAGRSGRHIDRPGRVVIQTYNPVHSSIEFTKRHDFVGFAEIELMFRQELNYPPFGRLASIRLQSLHVKDVEAAARELARRGRLLKKTFEVFAGLEVLGPAEAAIARLRNLYRFHILIKGSKPGEVAAFCTKLTSDLKWLPKGVKVLVDVDPMQLL